MQILRSMFWDIEGLQELLLRCSGYCSSWQPMPRKALTHTYHQNQLSCESHGFDAWEPEKIWSAAVLSVFLFVVVPAWWVRAVPCLPLR